MSAAPALRYRHRHLLGIEGLSREEIGALLDLSETYVAFNRSADKKRDLLHGRTLINLFFENSTRTRTSFELAGKRLGADVINMQAASSSIKKGETLIDTAMTLNAMHPDVLVVRHPDSGAVNLLSQKVDCAVINGGDGSHEHPTQALLDALTIRRRRGRLEGLLVAICGDILHSRVARSNIHLLTTMGARVRVIAPPTLLPGGIERLGVEVFTDMRRGLEDCDIVMMLRLQTERMQGAYVPSIREYFHFYGLDREKLAEAKPDALIMHPGPMNRGVEIDSEVADDIDRSLIREQVEMGVAVRMACLDVLTRQLRRTRAAMAQPEAPAGPGQCAADRSGERARRDAAGCSSSTGASSRSAPAVNGEGLPDEAEVVDARAIAWRPASSTCASSCASPARSIWRPSPAAPRRRRPAASPAWSACPIPTRSIDDVAAVEFIARRARETRLAKVYCYGAVTKRLEGQDLVEMGLLGRERCARLHRRAEGGGRCPGHAAGPQLRHAPSTALIIQHPEEPRLAEGGMMNAGELATRLGPFRHSRRPPR